MELLGMEDIVVGFGDAFIILLVLIAAAAAIALGWTAREEKTGHRLLWAEWPEDEKVETAPEVEFRKAA